ncbi:T-cell ecto-ADP-ribosyltransferase 2-like [Sorex araneus]|uniref:T-cell ecto-ADP-ribosyltransferase 2-like n=1 Tax=Sorex araneus TaxID=42254 RepID=UPI0024339E61|nr:T-cell ecto-ADP-ribosyltransferase 2-like [Sorex araneus]
MKGSIPITEFSGHQGLRQEVEIALYKEREVRVGPDFHAGISALEEMAALTATVHLVILTACLLQQQMGPGTPTPLQVTGLEQQPTSCLGILDMAYNAFDDQYEGCTQQMDNIAPQLLEEELKMNQKFQEEWKNAEKHWKEIKNTQEIKEMIPKSFRDAYGIALVAYTGEIAVDFNKAVREFGQNPKSFHFKAFHYYLTRALQLLSRGKCYKVYRGCPIKFQYSGSSTVRLGQFTSTSLSKEIALQFSGPSGTLFIIETCLGVYIEAFSKYRNEKEVLLPGYEVYQKVTKNHNNFFLGNPKKGKSTYNCFHVSSGSSSATGIRGSSKVLLLLPGFLLTLLLLQNCDLSVGA